MKTQNRVAGNSTALKSIFLALLFLLTLMGTYNLAYAAGQNDFYGVWKGHSSIFFEINKDAITKYYIYNNGIINKTKYRIIKWEKWENSPNYTIYALSESNNKVSFKAKIDAYKDLHIDEYEMKKSSTAELNKVIKETKKAVEKAAEEAKKAAEEAEAAFKARVKKGSYTDTRDNKTYKTLQLDNQIWMAENLNYEANGSKCYDNEPENCQKYGRLYDWGTAMKSCPSGWRLPSNADWDVLVKAVGGKETAGKILKATSGWNRDGNGFDAIGFSALPGGYYWDNRFGTVGEDGNWWSATDGGYIANMDYVSTKVYYGGSTYNEAHLFSVRCVQDKEYTEAEIAAEKAKIAAKVKLKKSSYTDTRDNKTYKILKLDNQVWMAENLNYEAKGSKCYGEGGKVLNPETNKFITLSNSEIQANCQKYGRLYDWETAKTACPSGWHLPSNAEWDVLEGVVGGKETAGKILKATSGWKSNGNGVDAVGFAALPGGFGDSDGNFAYVGNYGYWWSATESDANYAYYRGMGYHGEGAGWDNNKYDFLLSVRCLQD